MDFDKLKEQLQGHGIKVGFLKKGLYKQVAGQIPDNSTIEAACEGLDPKSANAIPVIITAGKIYLVKYASIIGGIDFSSIDRKSVTGVDVSGGILATLAINTAGQRYEITKVGKPQAMSISRALS